MTATPENQLQIKRLRVEGLFGRQTLEVPFRDNRLIIVGQNGSGKSTVMNILYWLLTCQWSKLLAAPFSRLELELGDEVHEVEKQRLEMSMAPKARRRLMAGLSLEMPGHRAEAILDELTRFDSDDMAQSDGLTYLSDRTGLPARRLVELARMQPAEIAEGEDDYIEKLTSRIRSDVKSQILFLPTYRRIERDLQALFPASPFGRRLRRRHSFRSPGRQENYLGLVEFGMQDVEEAFEETTQRLDREFRAELNKLTGEHLRDTLRSQNEPVAAKQFLDPELPQKVDDILGRMDDQILPQKERDELKKLIETVQQEQKIRDEQRAVLHFVDKLMRVSERQRKREERVTKLVEVCNGYLKDKRLRFDSQQFNLYLARFDRGKEPAEDAERIPARCLSPGEKQIVSLFTHLYLSDATGYFVMIDEPELSISAFWQKTLLPDIVKTGLCHGLVAVTHSPFIFDNDLTKYARSMCTFPQQ